VIIGPVVVVILVAGNSSVAIGLWPAHIFWTYYCVLKTKRVGWVLKTVAVLLLPLPLALWPAIAIIGSLLGGVGFGFFAPLIATFEVIGTDHKDKCFHCFVDGCYSTLETSCTVVRDFTDICFHSYFSFMDDLSEEMPADEKPIDIRYHTGFSYNMFRSGEMGMLDGLNNGPGAGRGVWDWLFKSYQVNGKILFRDGLKDVKDIKECIVKGRSDEVELTRTNLPRDKVFEWFIGPLLVMKEQIKGLQLSEDEEFCLRKLVMKYQNMKPEDWDDSGFPSNDHVRRSQLQAIIRRLQGIVGSMSRMPTFRRKFKNLVKVLYLEALQAGIIATPPEGGGLKRRLSGQRSIEKAGVKNLTVNKEEKLNDAQVTKDWASLSKMHDRLAIHLATCNPFEPSKVSVGLTALRVLFLLLSEFEQIFIMYVNQKTFDAAYDEQKRHHITPGSANMAFDLDVLPWPGNANMAFDLDVLPWPGNANMAFDLRSTKDILSWPGNANMAFDLVPDLNCLLRTPDSPGAVRRLPGPCIVLPTKKNRLEGDPRPEPRDPPSDGQVRIVYVYSKEVVENNLLRQPKKTMKTAPTIILILNDDEDSFATAITTGLQTSNLKQSTEVFELSLERYGVTDVKAAGSVTHFVDSNGVKQV
nr:uncharacterized membrane protein At3g27390 isoform X1 [Tanacetum cinerariifolium]